ncbi:PEP-CTERM sorting domain-containing protein [Massilia sp. BJB1822]|uniref:PEP-CTERM sorting domain-containing protein n=1 Tax=Massilia sp. BJB1822 TaxID=2744470 RepID=UPI001593D109|nr:PEP-CTERM sorting domain-containing protein [Massilia sp. BJB1822]NVD99732.1 PEP-CTERM sorting domain-containing protein [Massilia sp. BJB1822]
MKKTLLAALLAGSALTAQAGQLRYDFAFTGLYLSDSVNSDVDWDPTRQLTGKFVGADLNGDNVIAINEITLLYINGTNYLYRISNGSSTDTPTLDSFRYTLNGGLEFSGSSRYTVGDSLYGLTSVSNKGSSYLSDFGVEFRSTVGPGTVFSIATSVPEPAEYLMLSAGLLGLGWGARRKRKAAERMQARG